MPAFLRPVVDALFKARHAIGLVVASSGVVVATATQLGAPEKGVSAAIGVLALAASDFDQAVDAVRRATPAVRELIDRLRAVFTSTPPTPPAPPAAA